MVKGTFSRIDLTLKLISVAPILATWHTSKPIQFKDVSGKSTSGTNFWLKLAKVIYDIRKKDKEFSDVENLCWNHLNPFVLKIVDIDPTEVGRLCSGQLSVIPEE